MKPKLPERKCAFCGKLFTPKERKGMLCSRECVKNLSYAQITRMKNKTMGK